MKLSQAALFVLSTLVMAACGKSEAPAPKAEAPKADAPKVSAAPAQPGVIKIGLAAPLTGPQAHIGLDIKNGTQLAVDDANAANIEVGGVKLKFELIAEDDEANPKTATVVAQKLADAKVAGVVGHFNSGASIPASRIYSDAGIPQISPSSTSPVYTNQGYKTTFRLVANDSQQGPAIGNYVVKKLGAKKVAIIDDRTAYGQGLADEVEKTVKAAGGEVVKREFTTDKATDFTAILTTLKGLKPDVIMFGGIDPQAGPMAKQMKSLGINAKFIGGDGWQTPNFIKLAGDAAEGAMASVPGLPKDQMPGGKEFLVRYKTKFGKEVELFAPFGYDAVNVFIDSMKRAGSTDPAKFLAEVGKTKVNGIIGPIAFDGKGDIKDGPITIFAVKAGKWEPQEIVGGPAK
ncbi:MAG: branched-chain amino acid ABC transporter substrate-binding protein [Burkholderiales bacterium]